MMFQNILPDLVFSCCERPVVVHKCSKDLRELFDIIRRNNAAETAFSDKFCCISIRNHQYGTTRSKSLVGFCWNAVLQVGVDQRNVRRRSVFQHSVNRSFVNTSAKMNMLQFFIRTHLLQFRALGTISEQEDLKCIGVHFLGKIH